jgi:hypothetical protein
MRELKQPPELFWPLVEGMKNIRRRSYQTRTTHGAVGWKNPLEEGALCWNNRRALRAMTSLMILKAGDPQIFVLFHVPDPRQSSEPRVAYRFQTTGRLHKETMSATEGEGPSRMGWMSRPFDVIDRPGGRPANMADLHIVRNVLDRRLFDLGLPGISWPAEAEQ